MNRRSACAVRGARLYVRTFMPLLAASLPGSLQFTNSRARNRGLQVLGVALMLLLGVTASAKKSEPAAAASSGPAIFTDSSAAGYVPFPSRSARFPYPYKDVIKGWSSKDTGGLTANSTYLHR